MRKRGGLGRLRRRMGRGRMRRRADASFAGIQQRVPSHGRQNVVARDDATSPSDGPSYPIRNVVVRDETPAATLSD